MFQVANGGDAMRTKLSVLAFSVLVGCGQKNPCDEYVEALCDCNEATCADNQATYENSDDNVNLQDICAENLDSAKAGDDEACEATADEDTGDA